MNRLIVRILAVIVVAVSYVACGRMLPPFAPEDLAPRQVTDLRVTPLATGIQFNWIAPESDFRGEPLRSLDGYRIERKIIEDPSEVVDESITYETIALVPDSYFAALTQSKKDLLEKGRPARKASVAQEQKKHEFIDTSLTENKRYLYRIVPVNQGGEIGEVGSFVDIEFAGLQSTVSISQELDSLTEDTEAPLDE